MKPANEIRLEAIAKLLIAAKAYASDPSPGTLDVLKWAAFSHAEVEANPVAADKIEVRFDFTNFR